MRVVCITPASVPPARMMSRWLARSRFLACCSSFWIMSGWQMTEESMILMAGPLPSWTVPHFSEPGVSSTSVTSTTTA